MIAFGWDSQGTHACEKIEKRGRSVYFGWKAAAYFETLIHTTLWESRFAIRALIECTHFTADLPIKISADWIVRAAGGAHSSLSPRRRWQPGSNSLASALINSRFLPLSQRESGAKNSQKIPF